MTREEFPNLDREESGSIGIGAMIVFIALILVAAVASTIIIKTAEELQQNAENTSDDTRKQISGKVSLVDVFVKTTHTFPTTGASKTDVATMEVVSRVSSGSLGVEDGDITWYITCKVSYTAASTTYAVVDSAVADTRAIGDAESINDEDLKAGGTYEIETLGDTDWHVITTTGGVDSSGYAVGQEVTIIDTYAPGAGNAGNIGTGTAHGDSYLDGTELTAGTVFKFEIALGTTDHSSDNVIDGDDFDLGDDPGCNVEAGTGQELELRLVVDGGGETLATLSIESLTYGTSIM
ncbi:MAG: hypothetical protein QF911_01555 [Candidatus Thalassarchaeaceae archaeon]|jgi:archaellin|nr:hypothetical protein [Candidatus Thalassarchaeaceae archaeon]